MRRTLVSLVLTGAVATATAAVDITDGELALLPAYCMDAQTIRYSDQYGGKMSPRAPYWVGLMGHSFWHIHHYCWGLTNLRRSQMPGVTPVIRQGTLQSVLGDYMYVVNNSPADFVLLPEIYTRIGDVHLLLGSTSQAYEAFMKAKALKPDYWPPYVRWAKVLAKSNQKAEARKLVAEGLRHSPGAKPLIDEYRLLGGDPGEIQPARKKISAANASASTATATATEP